MSVASLPQRRIFYGWYIVAAGTANGAFVLGMALYGFGVFIPAIRDDMGWSTSALALGFTFQRIENGLFAPVVGYATDRLGPRRLAFVGVTLAGAGMLMLAAVTELWHFYVASIVIAFGQSMGSIGAFGVAIVNWFYQYRARAFSFVLAGTGIGAFTVYPLALLVAAIGWRGALLCSASVVFAVGYGSAFVMRDRPEPYGLRPDGVDADTAAANAPPPSGTYGVTARQALKGPAFWLVLLASIMFGFTNLGWLILSYPALEQKGFSSAGAGAAVALYGVTSLTVRVLLGWVGDRVGRQRLLLLSFPLQAAGLGVFALADNIYQLLPYFALYAVGHSGYAITSQSIVADYFGTRRFATIRGWLNGIGAVGGATGPVLGAWVYEQTGTYDATFGIFVVACMVGIPAILLAHRFRPRLSFITPVTAPAGAQ